MLVDVCVCMLVNNDYWTTGYKWGYQKIKQHLGLESCNHCTRTQEIGTGVGNVLWPNPVHVYFVLHRVPSLIFRVIAPRVRHFCAFGYYGIKK